MTVRRHLRVTIAGTFGLVSSPVETWATGLAIAEDTALAGAKPGGYFGPIRDELLNGVGSAAAAWFARTTSLFSTVQHLRSVTIAHVNEQGRVEIGPDGAYVQRRWLPTAPQAGTASTGLHPFQTALVASLQTRRSGPGGRGRMFLPVHAGTVNGDGRLDAAAAAGVAASLSTFLQAVNAVSQYPTNYSGDISTPGVVVVSSGSVKRGQAPVNTHVNQVRVGRVMDTMRSRRRNLVEEYQLSAVPAPVPAA